jgi:hypothetical protein
MKNIICFLTVRPSTIFYNYCKRLKNDNYDVYICIDDNSYTIPDYDGVIPVIQYPIGVCEADGFKGSVLWFQDRACSRDKALHYFCKNAVAYDYIWFLEDDVFVPTVDTISQIDVAHPVGDLLSASNGVITERKMDWNWKHVHRRCRLPLPYACSMVCAVRCSKALLTAIYNYAMLYNDLFMDEALFNTIALHHNLNIINPLELSTVHYKTEWKVVDIKGSNLYHPVKGDDKQTALRLAWQGLQESSSGF